MAPLLWGFLGFRKTIILQGFLARTHHDFHYIQISPTIICACTVAPEGAAIQFFCPASRSLLLPRVSRKVAPYFAWAQADLMKKSLMFVFNLSPKTVLFPPIDRVACLVL
jgi:hypothetical protein